MLVYISVPLVNRTRGWFVVGAGGSKEVETTLGCVDGLALPEVRLGRSPSGCVPPHPKVAGCGFLRTLRFIGNEVIAPTGTASE